MKKNNKNKWSLVLFFIICLIACSVFFIFAIHVFDGYYYYYSFGYFISIIIPFVVFVVSYSLLVTNYMRRKARFKKTKESYEIITKGFKDGTILNENDVRRIYEVYGLSDYNNTLASYLDNYLVFLLKEKDDKIQYSPKDDKFEGGISYQFINKFLSEIINRERVEKPYEGVNERERKLLQDIEIAAYNNRPTEVKSGLSYLANALMESQKMYSKENRRNTLLTKIGVLVTVLSLIAAIIIFFIQNDRSITNKEVKQDMKEVIDSCAVIDTNGIIDYRLHAKN